MSANLSGFARDVIALMQSDLEIPDPVFDRLTKLADKHGLGRLKYYDPKEDGPIDAERGELVWVWGQL